MLTILSNNRITKSINARVINDELHMPAADYAALPQASSPQQPASPAHNTLINVSAHCHQLNRPLLHNKQADVWALGASASERSTALQSLQAPDFTLSDLDGNPHSLSDYRGKKIFLASWASW